MSETRSYCGTIEKVNFTGTVEDWCKNYCKEIGITDLDSYHKNWQHYVETEFNYEYIVFNNNIFHIVKLIDASYDSIFKANYDKNENIRFVVQYYDGGMSFDEAIKYALNTL